MFLILQKPTDSAGKNELLFSKFGTNYAKLPEMFRKGSVLYRSKVCRRYSYSLTFTQKERSVNTATGLPEVITHKKKRVVITHEDIIGDSFWKENSTLLTTDSISGLSQKSKTKEVKEAASSAAPEKSSV